MNTVLVLELVSTKAKSVVFEVAKSVVGMVVTVVTSESLKPADAVEVLPAVDGNDNSLAKSSSSVLLA